MNLAESVQNRLNELLENAYDGPQIDFNVLCDRLQSTVFMVSFDDPDVNGMVRRADNKGFEIFLRVDHPKNRQRFTLAHEIGHIISFLVGSFSLQKLATEGGYIERRTQSRKDPAEIEANEIAACILMPEEFLESLISKLKNPTLENLANEFGVSTAAMSVRLTRLGYDPNDFTPASCF